MLLFIQKLLDSIYSLLFGVTFTSIQFENDFYKYVLMLLSLYIVLRLITSLIGLIAKFIKGVFN